MEGPHARLAVECDGDRWHGPDVWHKDRARQQVLERANWTFERIRGSAFYRDPDTALLPLWNRLADLGIPAGDWWSAEAPQPTIREVSGAGGLPGLKQAAGEPVADSESDSLKVPHPPFLTPAPKDTDSAAPQPSPLLLGTATSPAPAEPADAVNFADPEEPFSGSRDSDDVGLKTREFPASSVPSGNQMSFSLLPYQAWTPRMFPHPDTTLLPVVIAGLQEIVAAEGPIHADRAYRLYTRATGGHRVGPDIGRTFHKATRQALRNDLIRQLDDEIAALDQKTLYVPGKPSILVRELGPRQLSDVPRSEVAELIKYLDLEDSADEAVKRAVLNAYGLIRLTAKTTQYLDECLSYNSRRPAAT